jgi:putative transposase
MSAARVSPEGRASARPRGLGSASSEEKRTCRSTSLRDEIVARKHPIHLAPLEKHNRSVIVYVTACTAKRRKILACPAMHQAIVAAWSKASTWLVGRYVILPDHLHFFCAPNGIEAPALERWMRYWKSRVTASVGPDKGELWQRDHWDRQLRRGQSYDEKWEYVRNNPVRHGYVKTADDWPYQGVLNELRW